MLYYDKHVSNLKSPLKTVENSKYCQLSRDVFTCSIILSIATILAMYWDNICEKVFEMCSPASEILTSIVTILASFEAISVYFKVARY